MPSGNWHPHMQNGKKAVIHWTRAPTHWHVQTDRQTHTESYKHTHAHTDISHLHFAHDQPCVRKHILLHNGFFQTQISPQWVKSITCISLTCSVSVITGHSVCSYLAKRDYSVTHSLSHSVTHSSLCMVCMTQLLGTCAHWMRMCIQVL